MEQEIREELEKASLTTLKSYNGLDPRSEKAAETADVFLKLEKLRIDEFRTDTEYDDKIERREAEKEKAEQELNLKERELQLKQEQLTVEEKRVERQEKARAIFDIVKLVAEVGTFIGSVIFSGYWMRKGYEFEENDTITSPTFKEHKRNTGNLLRLKK